MAVYQRIQIRSSKRRHRRGYNGRSRANLINKIKTKSMRIYNYIA